ncbi:MAG TPA: hypothetical protein VGJ41_11785 [Nocardioides sp.]|jgi:ABC-type transporter Mla MlaB component
MAQSNDDARSRHPRPSVDAAQVDLDVSWLVPPDLAAVDALARLQLAAARCGRSLWLHGADGRLVELLDLLGLGQTLHVCACAHPPAGDVGDAAPGDY